MISGYEQVTSTTAEHEATTEVSGLNINTYITNDVTTNIFIHKNGNLTNLHLYYKETANNKHGSYLFLEFTTIVKIFMNWVLNLVLRNYYNISSKPCQKCFVRDHHNYVFLTQSSYAHAAMLLCSVLQSSQIL